MYSVYNVIIDKTVVKCGNSKERPLPKLADLSAMYSPMGALLCMACSQLITTNAVIITAKQ